MGIACLACRMQLNSHHFQFQHSQTTLCASNAVACPQPTRCRRPSPPRSIAAATQQTATTTAEGLQVPHGGKLVDLMVPAEQQAALVASCTQTLELSDRNACDVELLCVGWVGRVGGEGGGFGWGGVGVGGSGGWAGAVGGLAGVFVGGCVGGQVGSGGWVQAGGQGLWVDRQVQVRFKAGEGKSRLQANRRGQQLRNGTRSHLGVYAAAW